MPNLTSLDGGSVAVDNTAVQALSDALEGDLLSVHRLVPGALVGHGAVRDG